MTMKITSHGAQRAEERYRFSSDDLQELEAAFKRKQYYLLETQWSDEGPKEVYRVLIHNEIVTAVINPDSKTLITIW